MVVVQRMFGQSLSIKSRAKVPINLKTTWICLQNSNREGDASAKDVSGSKRSKLDRRRRITHKGGTVVAA